MKNKMFGNGYYQLYKPRSEFTPREIIREPYFGLLKTVSEVRHMEIIYQPNTIVQIIRTGGFAKIKRRCLCEGYKASLHYEAWSSDSLLEIKQTLRVVFQEEIESLPYLEPSEEERKKAIDTLAEIIVNVLFKEIEEGRLPPLFTDEPEVRT